MRCKDGLQFLVDVFPKGIGELHILELVTDRAALADYMKDFLAIGRTSGESFRCLVMERMALRHPRNQIPETKKP